LLELVLLPNTDSFQQFWSVFSRSRTSSDKNLQIVEGGQYIVEVEQALTKIFKLLKESVFSRSRTSSDKNLNNLKILLELVLLPNTDSFQQFED
jgi:hypothetical protein